MHGAHFSLACAAIVLTATTSWAQLLNYEMVPVGDPGNAADTLVATDTTSLYGAVPYEYQIGKYEVTIGQYTAFLNAVAKADPNGLYNTSMATDLNIAGISRTGSAGAYQYSVIGPFGNQANYFDGNYSVTQQSGAVSTQNYLTDVDAFPGSPSAYSTFGQSGNVSEYNDLSGVSSTQRGIRGGGWMSGFPVGESASSFRRFSGPELSQVINRDGFRLSRQIPNPVVVFNIASGTTRSQLQEGMAVISSAASVTKSGPEP